MVAKPNVQSPDFCFPDIGGPIKVYKKAVCMQPQYKAESSTRIDWLNDSVDLIFSESFLVVVSATPQTALKDFADKMSPRMCGLALAGIAAGLTLSAVGAISEGIFGKCGAIDQISLAKLFGLGLAIYAKKGNLLFGLSARKRAIFYTDHTIVVSGVWSWIGGQVDVSLTVNDLAQRDGGMKKIFQQGKCTFDEVI